MIARALLVACAVLIAATPADARRHRLRVPPPRPLPHASGVVEREFEIHLTHAKVAAGAVSLSLKNAGEDDHDLAVEASGTTITSQFLGPGTTATLDLVLPRGTYTLFCSLADHRTLGMETTLAVR